jgi:TatD DNase family protein
MESKSNDYGLVDIGVNFTSKKFKKWQKEPFSIDNAILNAREKGVKTIIGISSDRLDVPKNIDICKRHDDIYCTAGVHPHEVRYLNSERFELLRKNIKDDQESDKKIVAIGECGLDYNRNYSTPESQRKWFRAQLDLAKEFNLPLQKV